MSRQEIEIKEIIVNEIDYVSFDLKDGRSGTVSFRHLGTEWLSKNIKDSDFIVVKYGFCPSKNANVEYNAFLDLNEYYHFINNNPDSPRSRRLAKKIIEQNLDQVEWND